MNRREAIQKLGATAGLGAMTQLAGRTGLAAAPQRASVSTTIQFPEDAVIRLVLKDERPENLGGGALLWHEHPLSANFASPPGAKITDEERLRLMVNELNAAQADGVGCLFATTHARWSAKELQFARDLASRSELPLGICGARDATGPVADSWWKGATSKGERRAVEELAEKMHEESIQERWAALGEISTWSVPTSELEQWYMKAVAKVQLRTDLRIYTHTPPQGCRSCMTGQLDLYESQGVDPRHVCIGHVMFLFFTTDDPGWSTHKAIAKRGAYVGFDNVGVPRATAAKVPEPAKLKMVLQLLDAGYEDQILLSADTFAVDDLKANRGPGFSSLLTMFVPKLRAAGVNDALIRKMTIDNPRRFFAFVPKRAQ